mgnify:CR=1 FL=1
MSLSCVRLLAMGFLVSRWFLYTLVTCNNSHMPLGFPIHSFIHSFIVSLQCLVNKMPIVFVVFKAWGRLWFNDPFIYVHTRSFCICACPHVLSILYLYLSLPFRIYVGACVWVWSCRGFVGRKVLCVDFGVSDFNVSWAMFFSRLS